MAWRAEDTLPFIRAIAERPDEDMPRLIYADWLEERGDPRAEFIRVQCTLASPDTPYTQRADLKATERALRAAHLAVWARPLTDLGAWSVLFRRGLPEAVTMRTEDFLKHAETLFTQAPVRDLSLLGYHSNL